MKKIYQKLFADFEVVDRLSLWTILFLLGFGLIQVYSSSYILGADLKSDGLFFAKKQFIFTVVGLVLLSGLVLLKTEILIRLCYYLYYFLLVALLMTLIPGVGVRAGGASRWLSLPLGFRIEPSEFRYQYDGGGNIHGYRNVAAIGDSYRSHFNFGYDGANRLIAFEARAATDAGVMNANGAYGFDLGHRLSSRSLMISGDPGAAFARQWAYRYSNTPSKGQPVHAPNAITFGVSTSDLRRESLFKYDDVGRLSKVRTGENGSAPGVLSDRRLDWDAAGRLIRVLGGPDEYWRDNVDFLREEYVYDFAGNRVLKIHRPIVEVDGERKEQEITSIYLTPFYARPADGRGTVQLSRGSLPVASMTPPVSETAEPRVTFLYPDLAVGTINASVLATGEVTNAEHTLIARREFSPFGLELTGTALAKPDGAPRALPPVFHGKELDRTTGFSSFGARYYSRDLGIWASPDPMQADYLFGGPALGVYAPRNLSTYAFAGQNPINLTDTDGNAIIAGTIAFLLVADRVYNYYTVAEDAATIYNDPSQADAIAKSRGTEIAAGIIGGSVAKYGVKGVKAAGRYIPKLKTIASATYDKLPKSFSKSGSNAVRGQLLWGSWKDYEKVVVGGKEYAQIGERRYTRHAVNRMQPRGLGAPAGELGAGRNVTPNMVESVIKGGASQDTMVDGVLRTIHTSGNVSVVTEDGGKAVVTILRHGLK